ncbi:MAG: DUF2147 domain-containing protein [Oxalobacteraceae bacterium]|jgi:uncharacterized protein (DUF2147 family)|nr:DUF2147 domain-containing protein [Oxalobacteraceae bacterium]
MIIRSLLLTLLFCSLSIVAHAADTASPVGVWRTIDDKTGKEKSLVRITEVNGEFRGTIEKLFREPNEDQTPNCEKCTGDKKNKPVLGMIIMTGLKTDGEMYTGGEILDPANGKTYKCKVWLEDKGKKLNVRGFIGMALLGRTQVWIREE